MFAKIVFVLLLFQSMLAFPQNAHYTHALKELCKSRASADFKRAVFVSENAYYTGKLNYSDYCKSIDSIESILKHFVKTKAIGNYKTAYNYAIFSYITEAQPMNGNRKMEYNFEDFTGEQNWSSMFVTMLLQTHKGNCHSLPYFYKIMADELGANASLAVGPNHLYIKHIDENGQWVNLELTNGSFSTDAWLMKSLNINSEAIRKGTYMAALTAEQSISLCIYDLALGYKSKFGYDAFVIECCDSVLSHYPTCVNAYMLKANALAAIYSNDLKSQKNGSFVAKTMISEAELKALYNTIDSLGHTPMPGEMYASWLKELEQEKVKATNKSEK